MRIGIDAHMLGDHSGGNESFYKGILDAFDTNDDNEYILFLSKGYDGSFYKNKFKIVNFTSSNAFIRNYVELTWLCIKYKLDILHTQYYIPFIRPCKTVVTIHDICFEHFDNIFNKGEYIRNKLLIPYAARKAKKIITVSEFSKKDIADTYHIDPDKIVVTYNAVSEEFRALTDREKQKLDVRGKFGIGDVPYLICVGNLQPRKNIPRLVDAFIRFKSDHKLDLTGNIKLVIVGKKAWLYDDSLKAAASSPDIVLTDYIDRNELVALLNDAVGFLYPSLFEGFGIPPLEALACGTNVAVSDIPVMHEILGGNALFFDPYDVEDIENAIEELSMGDGNSKAVDLNKNLESLLKFRWIDSANVLRKAYLETVQA